MVECMRREVVIQNKDVIKKTIHCLSRRKSLLLRFPVSCWYNWCQTAWHLNSTSLWCLVIELKLEEMVRMKQVKNRVSPMTPTPGQYVERMDSRNSLCTNLSPHLPPHSSKLFALKILTKELSHLPKCQHAYENSCCEQKNAFVHLTKIFPLWAFLTRGRNALRYNIYNNTRRHKPLMSKSFQSLKLIFQNKSTRF